MTVDLEKLLFALLKKLRTGDDFFIEGRPEETRSIVAESSPELREGAVEEVSFGSARVGGVEQLESESGDGVGDGWSERKLG